MNTPDTNTEFVGAKDVALLLNISLKTLYAYVSRGRLGRFEDAATHRSLFRKAEVQEFARRRDRGKHPANVAKASLDYGLPVLETRISAVKEDGLWFRQENAVSLAERASLEDVAALLWEAAPLPAPRASALSHRDLDRRSFIARFMAWLLRAAQTYSVDAVAGSLEHKAAALQVLHAATAIALRTRTWKGKVHEALASGWSLSPARQDVLRQAMILHADHELNPSTFVVRSVASTRANIFFALLAGCCAASGERHGSFARSRRLVASVVRGGDAKASLDLSRGERLELSGFSHPLYPSGDPRAAFLLMRLREVAPGTAMARIDRFLGMVHSELGLLPKNDFAMATMAHLFRLPADACQALFVIARCVGWTAHALEQYELPGMIRPRSRYLEA